MFPLSNGFQKLLFFRCQICNNKHPGRIRGNCMVPLTRGIRAFNIKPPTDSSPTSNPLTMINTCIQHAKTQTGCFFPLLDQSSDSVCHSIPSIGCMFNKKIASPLCIVSEENCTPKNTLIFVCNARTTMLQ